MSPAPARTSPEVILAAARTLLEEGGLEDLTMPALAGLVGVKAPSLYKHFEGRAAIVRLVVTSALEELRLAAERAAVTGDPAEDLRALAHAYRAFARRQPRIYPLLFDSHAMPGATAAPEVRAASAATLLRVARELVGEREALSAARTILAFLHGFATMENVGAFQFGGSVDEAFELGVRTLLDGFSASPHAPPPRRPTARHRG